MIFYGTGSRTEVNSVLLASKCPKCGSENTTYLSILQKYAHIYWIPIFPTGKATIAGCNACRNVYEDYQIPSPMREEVKAISDGIKTPFWAYSALMVIAVLIGVVVFYAQQHGADNQKAIAAPQKGDVYDIKLDNGNYTAYHVIAVQKDSVVLEMSEFETTKQSGLDNLHDKGYSDSLVYALPKTSIKTMFDKGEIIDVARK
jgi:predicted RNA-binding Zn-ribbon protein involved in translation (DUF1610 family)